MSHLHSSCLQKLIYSHVSPLPVEGDVIIGRVWTCLCLRSVIYTQTEVFSGADFGGCARAGWYPMAVGPQGHNQELPFSSFPPAPLRTPQNQEHPQSPFLARHGGRLPSFGVQGQRRADPWKCLVFKEAPGEASVHCRDIHSIGRGAGEASYSW